MSRYEDRVAAYLEDAAIALQRTRQEAEAASRVAELMIDSLRGGGTVFWMGNGGSASDAQHLAAELVGRFEKDRAPLRSVALTTDTSILTAVGNDFGFETVFQRQVLALVRGGDVVVGISTSGTSENVLRGLDAAAGIGARTVLMTGSRTEVSQTTADVVLQVQSGRTCHIQEGHIALGQVICGIVEDELC